MLDASARSVHTVAHLEGVRLPSHVVVFEAPVTTTTTAPPTTVPPAPATTTTAPPPPRPIVTTTTIPAPPTPQDHEVGIATWYAAAPAGYCASPTLPFGTVVRVVNNATGASTVCRVDDREGSGYPRVVDLSPEGFSQIASLGQGVVAVTISW